MCALAVLIGGPGESFRAQQRTGTRQITWDDMTPLGSRLEARSITAETFSSYVEGLRRSHAARVRLGDLDHLVFYMLQSTQFTSLAPIEPALSARALVASLDDRQREAFLRSGQAPRDRVPPPVTGRTRTLLRALDAPGTDQRLLFFQALVWSAFPIPDTREEALATEYLRVMQFVYRKEFEAQNSRGGPAAVAELYRERGLSTDTAVEAGYVVYLGLGILKSLQPDRLIRRVLVVGPGLDLAPRTALTEIGPPESYQPWAVMDALLSLGLSRADDLQVVAADINPRVVDHLRRAAREPPALTLASGIRETATVTLSTEYREYFEGLGRAIGQVNRGPAPGQGGRLQKTIRVSPPVARMLRAETLDIVTDRFGDVPFDLVIATNILPYFDDTELMLAITNIAIMLSPGGVFLHNEARAFVGEIGEAVGLPFEQSRHAVIARVADAPAPLFDSVFLHRKK